jgi:hypothetical protein
MRTHRDPWRATRDPHPTKKWLAFRVRGSRSERYAGVIYADTQRAAEQEAFKVFSASSEMDRRKVYVRQHP